MNQEDAQQLKANRKEYGVDETGSTETSDRGA